jgi:hypothetical protein
VRHANRHDGAVTGRGNRARALILLAVLVAAPLALAGCHDEERLRERLEGPTRRLPVEPDQPSTPPAPALLDTVRPWQQPKGYGDVVTNAWDIVEISGGDGWVVSYRIPMSWENRGDGKARSRTELVDSHLRMTSVDDSEISLATYAAQLAEGNPIWQYPTADGHIVYLTRREVALAPSDPSAPREVFHTAVVSIDGRIAKLDVRYNTELDWRYDELAAAITGTLQVRRRDD